MRFTEFASKDSCPVCGQTPCNCTHLKESVTLDRGKVPGYPQDPATQKHRLDTARAILSDPKSDPESRREAAAIIAQAEKQGAADDKSLDEDLRKWFKEKWVRFGPDGKIRGDCARGDDSEGKPKCLPQAKAHALGKKGRASAAARKRREDPNPERRGPAKNVATKKKSNEGVAEGAEFGSNYAEQLAQQTFDIKPDLRDENEVLNLGYSVAVRELGSRARGLFRDDDFPSDFVSAYGWLQDQKQDIAEQQLDEKCWDGYHKEGNKELFGKTVPNCVKNESAVEQAQQCPECGGPMFSELMINEKQDACYYKVKSRYKVWPSAYASGALVQCRKKGAKNWGNKSKNEGQNMKINQVVAEAANPAQQAAIAIAMKKAHKKPQNENHNPEYDDEAGMADNNLETLKRAVQGIDNVIQPGDNLPEWCQEKIAVAKSMLVAVWDYMKSEEDRQLAEAQELANEFDLIESIIDRIAAHNGVDADVVWEDLESLTEDELYAFAVTSQLNEDWQKANKKDRTDGMSRKAVKAYRREHPGSKLQTAVTTKPSKLKKGSKASKRRKSYCSRSRGQMKMHNISCAKTPDKAICKARRRWNC